MQAIDAWFAAVRHSDAVTRWLVFLGIAWVLTVGPAILLALMREVEKGRR